MNAATAARLVDLNRRFYMERGHDFAETRQRVQPGVRRLLASMGTDDSILDLGCGSGSFANELARRGHRGQYLGIDFSPTLLEHARAASHGFPAAFEQADLTVTDWTAVATVRRAWDCITMMAVLHHFPGRAMRTSLLTGARAMLQASGRLILSNWQFSHNPRFRSRMHSWSEIGLLDSDVDGGDYLLDWRRGAAGLRYVHEFSPKELAGMAQDTGFRLLDEYTSDGADGRSGLYQIWQPGAG